ncbi:MAG: hypothetical protein CMK44_00460, partial [Porticoccus sp.]|nr:hypothetical protein [Porticoccus sp.]
MEDHINIKNTPNSDDFRIEIFRYLSFWPYYFISVIIFLLLAFIYLRYSENIYSSSSQIEIIDKAQDSEMALPTSMTIFNRSMINLENEIGVIKSFRLHKKALSRLNSNVRFLIEGRIKSSELHKTEWWNEYKFDLKSGFDNYVFLNYEIYISNNMLIIKHIEADGRLIKEYS